MERSEVHTLHTDFSPSAQFSQSWTNNGSLGRQRPRARTTVTVWACALAGMSALRPWWLLFCLAVLGHDLRGSQAGSTPSAANTLVWGPGLEASVVLPARFFYIQAADSSGKKWVMRGLWYATPAAEPGVYCRIGVSESHHWFSHYHAHVQAGDLRCDHAGVI